VSAAASPCPRTHPAPSRGPQRANARSTACCASSLVLRIAPPLRTCSVDRGSRPRCGRALAPPTVPRQREHPRQPRPTEAVVVIPDSGSQHQATMRRRRRPSPLRAKGNDWGIAVVAGSNPRGALARVDRH
jgi:hypothetical protein